MPDLSQDAGADSSEGKKEPSFLSSSLAAVNLGKYLPNHAIIKLDRDASIWIEANPSTVDRLAVFVHEYVHYLHNFSTVAGIYGFIAMLRMARLVLHTVGRTGVGHGDSALNTDQQNEFKGLVAWRRHLSGDVVLKSNHDANGSDIQIVIKGIVKSSSVIRVGSQDLKLHNAEIELEVSKALSNPERTRVQIGSHILMEGLAWEVERILHRKHGSDTEVLDRGFPIFPYKLSRITFEDVAHRKPTDETMVKILLLALQSSNPGDALLAVAQVFRNSAPHEADEAVVERCKAQWGEQLNVVARALCDSTLPLEGEAFASRGHAGRGLIRMLGWCQEYLRERIDEPFFELDLLESSGDRDALREFLRDFPACPILHEAPFIGGQTDFFYVSEGELDLVAAEELGAAQGLLQFVESHLTPTGVVAVDFHPEVTHLAR